MGLACLEAIAARDTKSLYRVLLSSPTNWLSCECVLLQKYTCKDKGCLAMIFAVNLRV